MLVVTAAEATWRRKYNCNKKINSQEFKKGQKKHLIRQTENNIVKPKDWLSVVITKVDDYNIYQYMFFLKEKLSDSISSASK